MTKAPSPREASIRSMAQSKDPQEACSGRLCLKLDQVVIDAIGEEFARGTEPALILLSLSKAFAMEMAAMAGPLANDGQHAAAIRAFATIMAQDMMAIADIPQPAFDRPVTVN